MIYDAFLFLNELELLDMRLHTLAPYVDRFVLVEANQTFSTLSGKGEFVFEKHRDAFLPWLDKIIYVKLDGEFLTVEALRQRPWIRRWRHSIHKNLLADQNETHHRNSILRGLAGAAPDDPVLISDIDEIIDPASLPQALALLKEHPVVGFEQAMYRYFLNNREKDFVWTLPRLTTCRYALAHKPHTIRGMKKIPVVKKGGWHFTCIGNMETFLYKIQSYMHHDRCYRGKYRDIDELKKIFAERVLKERRDIFDFMDSQYEFVAIDGTFPAFIRENRERFRELIYAPDPAKLPGGA
jgi:beta-1,4-mannosyl-glycoprotein beta-1,4-N-acetylglucosaminyltransferase